MLDFLLSQGILATGEKLAAIGSGTGIFTRQLLELGAEDETLAIYLNNSVSIHEFENKQTFDLNGFIGRLRSTSYASTPD